VKQIGIIGGGALGRQILGLLAAGPQAGRVFFFDDPLHGKGAENCFPFADFQDPRFADCEFYVGLGYRHLPRRAEIVRQLLDAGRRVPALVHPSSHVAPSARVGEGCLLYPLANVDAEAVLEPGVLLNNSVVVSHHSRVGTAAFLAPGVVLSGHVSVGAAAFLGSGAVVADHRRIGARARVGVGTVVTGDVPDDASVIGNPQRLLARPLSLE